MDVWTTLYIFCQNVALRVPTFTTFPKRKKHVPKTDIWKLCRIKAGNGKYDIDYSVVQTESQAMGNTKSITLSYNTSVCVDTKSITQII